MYVNEWCQRVMVEKSQNGDVSLSVINGGTRPRCGKAEWSSLDASRRGCGVRAGSMPGEKDGAHVVIQVYSPV